jgi:biopolymer transport protein ExbB/TolQ
VSDRAALAANWKTVVAVDLGMGLVVVAAGVICAVALSAWWWLLAGVGSIQLFFAGGRATKWRRIRREAGV